MAQVKSVSSPPVVSLVDTGPVRHNCREADLQQASRLSSRLFHSVYLYPTLAVILGLSDDFVRHHPAAIPAYIAVISAGLLLRLYFVLRREPLYETKPALWRGLALLSVILIAG